MKSDNSSFFLAAMMRYYVTIVSTFLIFLFAYTAIDKLARFNKNTVLLDQMPMLGGYGTMILGMVIVGELLAVVLLMVPSLQLKGLYVSLALMAVFTTYLGIVLLQGEDMPCSCGGVIAKMGWKEHLGFNCVVMGMTGIAIRNKK